MEYGFSTKALQQGPGSASNPASGASPPGPPPSPPREQTSCLLTFARRGNWEHLTAGADPWPDPVPPRNESLVQHPKTFIALATVPAKSSVALWPLGRGWQGTPALQGCALVAEGSLGWLRPGREWRARRWGDRAVRPTMASCFLEGGCCPEPRGPNKRD